MAMLVVYGNNEHWVIFLYVTCTQIIISLKISVLETEKYKLQLNSNIKTHTQINNAKRYK